MMENGDAEVRRYRGREGGRAEVQIEENGDAKLIRRCCSNVVLRC